MPTYEYKCKNCGQKFELRQAMTDLPLTDCPECHGKVRRLVSGGAGFILKDSSNGPSKQNKEECSFEKIGKTCCGSDERCGKSSCGGEE